MDQTFRGLYRWNAFDVALLIPYFIVMLILAFYGVHRYQLVWLYYRNRKNASKWDEPPMQYPEGELPFVGAPGVDSDLMIPSPEICH